MSLVRKCDRCRRDLTVLAHRLKFKTFRVDGVQKPLGVLPKRMEVCTECASELRIWSETPPEKMPVPYRKSAGGCDSCKRIVLGGHFLPILGDEFRNIFLCKDCYGGQDYHDPGFFPGNDTPKSVGTDQASRVVHKTFTVPPRTGI